MRLYKKVCVALPNDTMGFFTEGYIASTQDGPWVGSRLDVADYFHNKESTFVMNVGTATPHDEIAAKCSDFKQIFVSEAAFVMEDPFSHDMALTEVVRAYFHDRTRVNAARQSYMDAWRLPREVGVWGRK